MLEVKNLKKIYKTKNGVNVNALDGVSLSFPENGMVFLLGKSGSGKSTLLNVCGGLDSPTEGEIIVKGRSSKDFSQSDFDSYRNTYVGFIFQEYNILNEFTVEDNIALALELQGKPKDKAAIKKLLEDVDLEGYAKRKPNTLSGGQKQRIAIARALIKAPEIIMADEPTGALDSNTGKQVLDTLKKLSRDKLVIVVSHDRDFAEHYGDRIIELKDGKVISDVSKTEMQQQKVSANVRALGDVLCIEKGATLTEADFAGIREFLENAKEDIIIAKNEQDVKNFKKVSRISDSGTKEVFTDTVSAGKQKNYTKEDSRFIRSKLPIRHAIKIGASGLKSKPVRLFFTILLCTVAFVLLGLLSTLNFYDSEATFRETMAGTDVSSVQLTKQYKANVTWYSGGEEQHSFDTWYETVFSDAEMKNIADQFGNDAFGAVRSYSSYNLRQVQSQYWINEIQAFAVLSEDNALRSKINGQYPLEKNEIVITSYAAQMLKECNAYDDKGVSMELQSPEELIGKTIIISGNAYKITGIFDSGMIDSKYEALKNSDEPPYSLQSNWRSYLADGLHQIVFVSADRLKSLAGESYDYKESIINYTYAVVTNKRDGEYSFPDWNNANYTNLAEEGALPMESLADGKTEPAAGEVILPISMYTEFLSNEFWKIIEDKNNQMMDEMKEEVNLDPYYKVTEKIDKLRMGGYYKVSEDEKSEEFIPYTQAEMSALLKEVVDAANKEKIQMSVGMRRFDPYNQTAIGDVLELNVIAVYYHEANQNANRIVLSQSDFDAQWNEHKLAIKDYSEMTTNYVKPAGAIYNTVYIPYVYSEAATDAYWALYNSQDFGADDSRITISSNFVYSIRNIDEMVKSLSQVFLYVGLVFAVFAALLLSNFISVSISQKKRDIGILRAVGARGADVFKIFFSESFVIAAICVALSAAGSLLICRLLNDSVAAELGAAIFVFGPISVAVLIGIALITAIVATFLPVFNAARKKPVDSIRAI